MTLREQMRTDIASVFHNTDEHGETFVYLPTGGSEREIIANVVSEGFEIVETRGGFKRVQTLVLFVSRDPVTGIDEPRTGDAIWRASTAQADIPAKAYAFPDASEWQDGSDGDDGSGDENGQFLRFIRSTPQKHGGLQKA